MLSKFKAGGAAWTQNMEHNSTDSSSDEETARIEMTGEFSEIRELLECPVCFDIILPPITLCSSGHSVCNSCQEKLESCPVCRREFTEVRNIFAEKFLEICAIACKFKESGCKTTLPGWELSTHQISCDFRGILCPECARVIPYYQFLHHLRVEEEMEIVNSVDVITGFQIEDGGVSNEIWEPSWIHCHDRDFFCFLNKKDSLWVIWIGVFGPSNVSKGFATSITIRSLENRTKIEFVGDVHPLRSPLNDVLNSEQCILLEDSSLKNFLSRGGIDIRIRIDREFQVAKEDRGTTFSVLRKQ